MNDIYMDSASKFSTLPPACDSGLNLVLINKMDVRATSFSITGPSGTISIPVTERNIKKLVKMAMAGGPFTISTYPREGDGTEYTCELLKCQIYCTAGERVDMNLDFLLKATKVLPAKKISESAIAIPQRVITWADCAVKTNLKEALITNFTISFGQNWQDVHIETAPLWSSQEVDSPIRKKLLKVNSIKAGKVKLF